MSRRIGVLGGAFNPPHYGHLRPALEALEQLDLQQVLFLPSGGHPFKGVDLLAPARHRLEMTRLAIVGEPRFMLCDLEAKRTETSYTVETLAELRRVYADAEIFFLLGVDLFQELHLWRRWQSLIELAHLCVMMRPGFESLIQGTEAATFLEPYRVRGGESPAADGSGYHVLEVTPMEAQSRALRRRLAQGGSIRYLTPDTVIDYLTEHGLYQPATTSKPEQKTEST
ncbi:MAG: nicotinate (nicotinamide) nucleotide adenylyltransferase [Magnetococcales bacterium]|nr:nicotinate (nicotinamide) nucleotide adenylyltransferase [Magnetococcales bacterium]